MNRTQMRNWMVLTGSALLEGPASAWDWARCIPPPPQCLTCDCKEVTYWQPAFVALGTRRQGVGN